MFPIRDPRGRVIGFGGRVLESGEPKYLNSPETELFHKGRELYGLHEARLARVKLERLLIVEGYMDVVRLHQAGCTTPSRRWAPRPRPSTCGARSGWSSEMVFCFDGDRAGRAAAWRALQNALPEAREGREIRFLFLPEGEDPDSLVGKEGREAFEARLAGALPLSEYLMAQLRAQVDMAHADGRARYVALARPLLAKLNAGVYPRAADRAHRQRGRLSAATAARAAGGDRATATSARGAARRGAAVATRGAAARSAARLGAAGW